MTPTGGAGTQALVAVVLFSLVLNPFACRDVQGQPPIASTAPSPSADAVDVKIVQSSSNSLEVRAKRGDLQARLALLLKDHTLTYSLLRRPGKAANEWPWFVDSAPLLGACLRTALSDPGKLSDFHFITRLAMYPEMSVRIALRAGTSKKWDHRFGRPKASFTNSFVMGLARDNDTYSELKSLFDAQQLRIQLESMESVSIAAVGDLPHRDILTAEGLSPEWLIPYDAVLHFRAKYAP
jgi:hypothetical protein